MTSIRTLCVLAAAALPGGFLAGADLDRALVAMPAWSEVGAIGWAAFSRHADLGAGLVLYPAEAVLAALLVLAAALSHRLDRGRTGVGLPLYAAGALSILGLVLTARAAPIMLSIRDMGDPVMLQQAFGGFRFWGDLRGACQVLAFVAEIGALLAIGAERAGKPPPEASLDLEGGPR